MNKILLIDADSKIPNLALMKLSAYYKCEGYLIELMKLNLPYYPNMKKQNHYINTKKYYKIFCSVIFQGNYKHIFADDIERISFGGTGVDLKKQLPQKIENIKPDYSIYPENNMSYGFISRGCIRKCPFCVVPEKEGKIKQVNSIDDIVEHSEVCFMDNNFLSLPNHKDVLKEIIKRKIKCQFKQGLDIRLITQENSVLISKLKHIGNIIFAFDHISYKSIIEKKLKILNWKKKWRFTFYIYVNPKMPLIDTVKRIEFLKENECLPYIMRDISCWGIDLQDFYTDIASWCNQPPLFKKMDFKTFLEKKHKNEYRIKSSLEKYEQI